MTSDSGWLAAKPYCRRCCAAQGLPATVSAPYAGTCVLCGKTEECYWLSRDEAGAVGVHERGPSERR